MKFKKNAWVFIYSTKLIDREDLVQYVGRGNRSGGIYQGTFFLVGQKGSESHAVEIRLKKRSDFKWLDGARVLKTIIEAVKTKIFNGDKEKAFLSHNNGKWITSGD